MSTNLQTTTDQMASTTMILTTKISNTCVCSDLWSNPSYGENCMGDFTDPTASIL